MEPSKSDEIAFMFKEVIDAVDENNMPIKQLVGLYGTYDFYDMSKNITDETTIAASAAITVYDTSRRGDSVIKGTVSDIKAYESVGLKQTLHLI